MPAMFDGIEVRRIRRQKEEVAPSSFDKLICFERLVKGSVILWESGEVRPEQARRKKHLRYTPHPP